MSKIEEKIAKIVFFGDSIFAFFGYLKNIKIGIIKNVKI